MRRRDFIALLGGAAAWPVAALAQQADRMRHIGVLMPAAESDPEYQTRMGAFQQAGAVGLDRRPQCAHRHSLGHKQCRPHSQIRRRIGRAGAGCDRGDRQRDCGAVTCSLPIVFVTTVDPVGGGFVESLAAGH
jgi:hypothetical protein